MIVLLLAAVVYHNVSPARHVEAGGLRAGPKCEVNEANETNEVSNKRDERGGRARGDEARGTSKGRRSEGDEQGETKRGGRARGDERGGQDGRRKQDGRGNKTGE